MGILYSNRYISNFQWTQITTNISSAVTWTYPLGFNNIFIIIGNTHFSNVSSPQYINIIKYSITNSLSQIMQISLRSGGQTDISHILTVGF